MEGVEKVRVAVFISGRGSNLGALIEACRAPSFPARIAVVLSDRTDAQGILRAEQEGIPTHVVARQAYPDRGSFETALGRILHESGADLICLAGFMRILSAAFVAPWRERILNIHPSLLPAFKGMHVHEQVLTSGVKITGCTVHFVTPEMDDGPIIAQAAVPVLHEDTVERLSARVLRSEHRLYPLALSLVAGRRYRLENGVVVLSSSDGDDDAALLNPSARMDPRNFSS